MNGAHYPGAGRFISTGSRSSPFFFSFFCPCRNLSPPSALQLPGGALPEAAWRSGSARGLNKNDPMRKSPFRRKLWGGCPLSFPLGISLCLSPKMLIIPRRLSSVVWRPLGPVVFCPSPIKTPWGLPGVVWVLFGPQHVTKRPLQSVQSGCRERSKSRSVGNAKCTCLQISQSVLETP